MVRSDKSAEHLKAFLPPNLVSKLHVERGDLTDPASLLKACTGKDTIVFLSSAQPQLLYSSLPGLIVRKLLGNSSAKPSFYFKPGTFPKEIEWDGGKALIDSAKTAGVKHIVYVGSLGGKREDVETAIFLNSMGGGNMLKWKRKTEAYLISSAIDYTIIHPGGLLPHFGNASKVPGGVREILVGVDDSLLDEPKESRMVPREDLAELCVLSLTTADARNRSFDVTTKSVGQGEPFKGDLSGLLSTLKGANCTYDSPSLIEERKSNL